MSTARLIAVVVQSLLIGSLLAGSPQSDERAQLSLAIRQGNLAGAHAIVEKNPSLVRSADDAGFTPLHVAATAGRVEIIEFLLDRGADIEARTPGGQTPLFQTVPLASQQAFLYLLGRGADLNARDRSDRTILQFALSWQRPAMVDLILSRGFRVSVEGEAAQEMLEEAANAGIESLVSALVAQGVPLDIGRRRGTTMLHSAARGGLPKFAERLITQGARVNERDLHGMTPLQIAAFYGHEDVVRVMVAGGADADARVPTFPALSGAYLGQPEPGSTPELFAPGVVSSEEHDTNIAFTPDGGEICFSRINADQTRRWLLFMRLENGRWAAPAPAPFASGDAEFECTYSPDGRRLFFSSNRPLQKDGPAKRDMDIWVVERAGVGWNEPRNLGPAVNDPSNEFMPSVDREGNLYFQRQGLNVARWRDGAYLPAEKAGAGITNVVNLGHPFIAPDGRYLLFDARLPGSDKSLLFASYRREDGTWSPATGLFQQSETKEYESCPTVSADGKYLFFGRDHDIYWVSASVIEQLRPKATSRQR